MKNLILSAAALVATFAATSVMAASSSTTEGYGMNCDAYVTCSSGQRISCQNSGVTSNLHSICVSGQGDGRSPKIVFCSIDDGNGTITSSYWNACR